jgi:hypothetical protein
MRIDPVSKFVTVYEVPVVPRLSKVARARQAEEDVLAEQQEQDIKDGRPKRRSQRMAISGSPDERIAPALLSALIDLQERR